MEAIGRLTGGIAHDFNNLLTGILGYSSLLKTFLPENGRGYEAAAYIERSARRASELTRQLLAYSRREAPTFRPVDLRKVTGEAIEILSRSVNKNVEIHTDFHHPQEPVSGDAGTLVQALLNLGVNASDAMPGGGHLTFSTSTFVSDGEVYLNDVLVPEGRYVSICVADTGSGIPEEIRDEVFAPFFTTKAPGEGTGLGLSMVYSCVRTHGGFVRLVSSVGVGTTFQILLPVMEESGDADEPREPETEIPRGTETVLVVDDEEIPLNLLCDVLRSLGYTTLPAVFRRGGDRDPSLRAGKGGPGDRRPDHGRDGRHRDPRAAPRHPSDPPDDPLLRDLRSGGNDPPAPFRTGSTTSSRSRTSGRRWPARCDPFSTPDRQNIDGLREVLTPLPVSPFVLIINNAIYINSYIILPDGTPFALLLGDTIRYGPQ